MVMKRVKAILRVMSFSLISGMKVPLEDDELAELKYLYFEEDDDEIDLEDVEFLEEEEVEARENIELEKGFIVYDVRGEKFCVVDQNGEGIIEAISVSDAMEIYNDFLIQEERRNLEIKAVVDLEKEREKAKQEEQERE